MNSKSKSRLVSTLSVNASRIRPSDEWCRDYANVLELAQWLEDECALTTAKEMLDYFAKPWKWTTEWNDYQATKRVTDDDGPEYQVYSTGGGATGLIHAGVHRFKEVTEAVIREHERTWKRWALRQAKKNPDAPIAKDDLNVVMVCVHPVDDPGSKQFFTIVWCLRCHGDKGMPVGHTAFCAECAEELRDEQQAEEGAANAENATHTGDVSDAF